MSYLRNGHPKPTDGTPKPSVDFASVIDSAVKLKKVMMKRGLTRARAKCPKCDGFLQGRLLRKTKYKPATDPLDMALHMRCDGSCGALFME